MPKHLTEVHTGAEELMRKHRERYKTIYDKHVNLIRVRFSFQFYVDVHSEKLFFPVLFQKSRIGFVNMHFNSISHLFKKCVPSVSAMDK